MAEVGSVAASGQRRYMMDAPEFAAALGIKKGMAYRLIRQWNEELKAMGKLTIRGKVNRKYFESKMEV